MRRGLLLVPLAGLLLVPAVALGAQPVTPEDGATTPTATPTFTWTAQYPGNFSTWRLTGSPAVSGSEGRMDAETIDMEINNSGQTSYTAESVIDAGQAWWQVCEEAPDHTTSCSAPRAVTIPIVLDAAGRSYTRATRVVRVELLGNLWRGADATVRLRGRSWKRTVTASTDSNLVELASAVPRRVKSVSLLVSVSAAGASKQFSLPRVRTR